MSAAIYMWLSFLGLSLESFSGLSQMLSFVTWKSFTLTPRLSALLLQYRSHTLSKILTWNHIADADSPNQPFGMSKC